MISEPAPATPGRRGPSLGLRFGVAFLLGALLVTGVGGGALYAYGRQYDGRILPGVRVAETDLSGLVPEAARTALADAYASLGAGRVLLAGPDGDVTIGYGEIGRGPDTTAMVDAALAAGRRGEPVADLIGVPQTVIRGVRLDPSVTYDPGGLAAAVDDVARAIDRAPVDATLTAASDGSYTTTPSVDGRVVDRAALIAAIDAQITRLDAPAELRLEIPFTTATAAIDTADAEAARAAGERMSADLVLTRRADSWTIPGEKLRPLISFATTADGAIAPIVDEAGLDPLIRPIAKALNQSARSATFRLSGNHVVMGRPSREGRTLDVAATRAAVLGALLARQAGTPDGVLEPVVAAVEPDLTTAAAQAVAPQMRPISSWKTWFPIWVRNGFGANIWVPAGYINGAVVNPGETFDFWEQVGEVSLARGYKQGNAIINGRSEPLGALAGGICSTSTTLFNAALRAGMKMGARRNHYYYINRYPKGLDATVFKSGGGSNQTMSFTNDTKYPLLIRTINTRSGNIGWVKFVIYSVPNGRSITIGDPVVKNFRKATDTIVYTSSLAKGVKNRVEVPEDGMDVWRTVTVRENGKVLRRTTYYSHYSVVTGILEVGTGGAATGPTPSPTPSPDPSPSPTTPPAP